MSFRCLLVFCLVSLWAPLSAQVTDGDVVICRFETPAGGLGGISLRSPRAPFSETLVTGLPTGITGTGSTTILEGGNALAVRESDGLIVVGDTFCPGFNISLHLVTLNGAAATTQTITLGPVLSTGIGFGAVDAVAFLNDDQVVFSVRGTGGWTNNMLGVLNVASQTPVPVPLVGLPAGCINAMSVDRSLGVAYFALVEQITGGFQTRVYSVPVPAGGTPTQLAVLNSAATGLAVENDGRLVLTVDNATNLVRIDPVTQSATTITTNINQLSPNILLNGVSVERATGNLLVCGGSAAISNTYLVNAAGQATDLGTAASGAPSDVHAFPNPRRLGPASPGPLTALGFATNPWPGGLPTIGNGAFALQIDSSPIPVASALAITTGALPAPGNLFGALIYVDPATLLLPLISLPPVPSLFIPLPLPNDPVLQGARLYFQAAGVGAAGGIIATEGITFTIL